MTELSRALDDLTAPMIALECAWTAPYGREGLGYAFRDALHHACVALAWLDGGRMDALADTTRVLLHEAYLAAIALALEIRRAGIERVAPRGILAAAQWAIDDLLDALAPLAPAADAMLRATTLHGAPYELLAG